MPELLGNCNFKTGRNIYYQLFLPALNQHYIDWDAANRSMERKLAFDEQWLGVLSGQIH
jgi:hypothetical protein